MCAYVLYLTISICMTEFCRHLSNAFAINNNGTDFSISPCCYFTKSEWFQKLVLISTENNPLLIIQQCFAPPVGMSLKPRSNPPCIIEQYALICFIKFLVSGANIYGSIFSRVNIPIKASLGTFRLT